MKLSFPKKLFLFLLFAVFASTQATSTVQAASYRQTDVQTPAKGNVLVGIEGNYEYIGKSKILKRINEIRKEACQNGYRNPSTGKKLTMNDYVPLKWSSDLEWIAQIRASEATVYESHTRPNGTGCFSVKHNGVQSWAENLAWNYSGLLEGIEQWYDEKNDWINQTPGAVTGHYTSMINPSYRYIGLGSFQKSSGGWYGISAEFGWNSTDKGTQAKRKGKTLQAIEVSTSHITNLNIQAPSTIKSGKKYSLTAAVKITMPGIMGGEKMINATVLKGVKWSSSKKSVLSVDTNGTIRAKKAGKAVISAKITGSKTAKLTLTVKK